MARHIKNWHIVKKRWKKKNPPDKDGNYVCWLCEQKVSAETVTLDHVLTVEMYPEYAKELSNLRPAHRWCNEQRAFDELKVLKGRGLLGINKPKNHNVKKRRI